MGTYFIQTDSTNPWWNLALEKVISENIKEGDVYLYLWQNDRTVVIGRNQNAIRECRVKELENAGGRLARRTTGGGAVYQDMGNLCFTFAASPECYDLAKQMSVIQEACKKFGINTKASGRNDILTEDGLKFSGNAFSETATCKIQHGTLMVSVDVENLGKFLTPSKLKMKAKGIESVRSRVCNLTQLNPDVTVEGMKVALREAFETIYGASEEIKEEELEKEKIENIYQLYSSWDWRFGNTPKFELIRENRFDWGEFSIHMNFKNMRISDCKVYSDTLNADLPEALEKCFLGQKYDFSDFDIKDYDFDPESEKKVMEIVTWLAKND